MNTSYAVAYAGGLVTLLAPCAAMMLPAFFSYAFSAKGVLARRTAVFFLGLLSGLVPIGALAGTLGAFLFAYSTQIAIGAGIVIIVLGIWQGFALPVPHLSLRRSARKQPSVERKSSPLGVYILGLTYGLAGAGCTGPILGAVLSVAGLSGSSLQGGIMMAFYAAGMFTPVVLLAFFWDSAKLAEKSWLKPRAVRFAGRYTTVGNLISAVIFIILGALLIVFQGAGFVPNVLDASAQSNLETSLTRFFTIVPNWLFIALFTIVIALIGIAVYNRKVRAKEVKN